MSRMRAAVVLIALALAGLYMGCSEKRGGSVFDPTDGHGENWILNHRSAAGTEGSDCGECHGIALAGGISGVSCFEASRNGQGCHPGGPSSGHGPGWALSSSHGAAAKAAPGASSGFSSCRACHGTGFSGGTGDSCFPCHGVSAPHPSSPWRGSGVTHTTVNSGNASVCAACHRSSSGTPGCFNNTLCHGEAGSPHGASWLSAHQGTVQGQASSCAACHRSSAGTPGCFNNTLCHGAVGAPHPSNWEDGHQGTSPSQASSCAACHRSNAGTPGCFNNTLCHGSDGDGGDDDEGGDDDD